jgi:hypothetical protein
MLDKPFNMFSSGFIGVLLFLWSKVALAFQLLIPPKHNF